MSPEPSITLAPTIESVAQARGFVRSHTPADADPDVVVLITSELVSNVVDHAKTDVSVTVEVRQDAIRVSVRDGKAATATFRELLAAPPTLDPTAQRGRGLGIAKMLASAVGLTDVEDGKILWFEVARGPT